MFIPTRRSLGSNRHHPGWLCMCPVQYLLAVLHGYTLPFGKQAGENPDKMKTKAFACIAERTVPGRWEHARKPTPTEFKGTAVIGVMIDSAR